MQCTIAPLVSDVRLDGAPLPSTPLPLPALPCTAFAFAFAAEQNVVAIMGPVDAGPARAIACDRYGSQVMPTLHLRRPNAVANA